MNRIALVSCVKSKRTSESPAGELYTSPLFRGLSAYAKRNADEWYILSAKFGLLSPTEMIAPYELTLNRMSKPDRQAWGQRVRAQLTVSLPTGSEILLLAGARYREELEPFLRERGHHVIVPLEGLSMGRQLAWLKRNAEMSDVCRP